METTNKVMEEKKMTVLGKVKRGCSTVARGAKKHSPLILMVTGIGLYAATGYFIYKARPAIENIVEGVEAARADGQEIDKVAVGKDLTKALAVPILTGSLATASVILSYKIQYSRLVTLSSVLAAAQAANDVLERKVRNKFGDEAYEEMLTTDEVETKVVDEEGNEKITVDQIKAASYSTYGEWYDKSEFYVKDDHSYNMAMILELEEKILLRQFGQGWIYLSEVREILGFHYGIDEKMEKRTGALVGWGAGDFFKITRIVTNFTDPVTGEKRPQIRLQWTKPHSVYENRIV